ncbi:MAG: hypothetical protein AAGM67_09835, partial [Bacteroidota bacterium]
MEKILQDFEQALAAYHVEMGRAKSRVEERGLTDPKRVAGIFKIYVEKKWLRLIREGTVLADEIATQKSIPKKMAKKYEMAARLFLSARRFPRNILKWQEKNLRHIDLLKNAAIHWVDKTEDEHEDEIFTIDGFTVYNVVHLHGQKLEDIKKLILQACQIVKKSKVPHLKEMLYGDLLLVGKLLRNAVAWYSSGSDQISIRANLKTGQEEILSLIHEL